MNSTIRKLIITTDADNPTAPKTEPMMRSCCMQKGVTLVELMISMAIAAVLVLAAYGMHAMGQDVSRTIRDGWYCMQSLRAAILQLDQDLLQCAHLLPQDMKVVIGVSQLFIAGAPPTADYSGLSLAKGDPPPYYAVVVTQTPSAVGLDTVDLDTDHVPDFRADLGLITDNGAYVIAHAYVRGNMLVPVQGLPAGMLGSRAVPAVYYALKNDGLYRNGQILAERIVRFEARRDGSVLSIHLRSICNGTAREIHYRYPIG